MVVRCDGARGLRPSPRIFANPAVGRRTFFEGAVVAVVVVAVVVVVLALAWVRVVWALRAGLRAQLQEAKRLL